MWVKAVSRFVYGDKNYDWLAGIWHLTDGMGQLSYVLRNCYGAYDGVKNLYVSFFEEIDDFPEFSAMVHLNVVQEFYHLNDYGWDAYLGYYRRNWTVFATGIARIIYLTIFADHFDNYDSGTQQLLASRTSQKAKKTARSKTEQKSWSTEE